MVSTAKAGALDPTGSGQDNNFNKIVFNQFRTINIYFWGTD